MCPTKLTVEQRPIRLELGKCSGRGGTNRTEVIAVDGEHAVINNLPIGNGEAWAITGHRRTGGLSEVHVLRTKFPLDSGVVEVTESEGLTRTRLFYYQRFNTLIENQLVITAEHLEDK